MTESNTESDGEREREKEREREREAPPPTLSGPDLTYPEHCHIQSTAQLHTLRSAAISRAQPSSTPSALLPYPEHRPAPHPQIHHSYDGSFKRAQPFMAWHPESPLKHSLSLHPSVFLTHLFCVWAQGDGWRRRPKHHPETGRAEWDDTHRKVRPIHTGRQAGTHTHTHAHAPSYKHAHRHTHAHGHSRSSMSHIVLSLAEGI